MTIYYPYLMRSYEKYFWIVLSILLLPSFLNALGSESVCIYEVKVLQLNLPTSFTGEVVNREKRWGLSVCKIGLWERYEFVINDNAAKINVGETVTVENYFDAQNPHIVVENYALKSEPFQFTFPVYQNSNINFVNSREQLFNRIGQYFHTIHFINYSYPGEIREVFDKASLSNENMLKLVMDSQSHILAEGPFDRLFLIKLNYFKEDTGENILSDKDGNQIFFLIAKVGTKWAILDRLEGYADCSGNPFQIDCSKNGAFANSHILFKWNGRNLERTF